MRALIVVDLQNDFAHPDGSLHVKGGEDVVAACNAEIERAHTAGDLVVYTQDWHPPSTPHFERDGGTWPVHCVRDTWGAELHDGVVVLHDATRVRKGTGGEDGYSGFTVRDPETGVEQPTELEALLRASDVTEVDVCGLALDVCVKETALDAARLGFRTRVLEHASAPVDQQPGDADAARGALSDAGVALGGA